MVTFFCVLDAALYSSCLLIGGISNEALLAVDQKTLIKFGAKDPYLMRYEYQVWRFFTPMFLHLNLVHILCNTFSTLVLGQTLEQDLGSLRFTALYLLSGFGGILLSALCSDSISVGASTAVFGLIGSYVSCLILNWGYLKRNTQRRTQILIFLAITLILGLQM